MCNGQLIAARERDAVVHPNIEPGKVYIIDYGASRRLELGPGRQPAVELPETQCKPPLGMKRFDPYSWDVYCTGVLFKTFVEVCSQLRPRGSHNILTDSWSTTGVASQACLVDCAMVHPVADRE